MYGVHVIMYINLLVFVYEGEPKTGNETFFFAELNRKPDRKYNGFAPQPQPSCSH
jgi:hypothetical protein